MQNVFNAYKKSLERLREVFSENPTLVQQDATIQRFEFTYELAWKSAQKYLREQGIIAQTPRDCFMELFRIGIIFDDPRWLQMIQDRNITAHTYDETLARRVCKNIKGYIELFEVLREGLEKKNIINNPL